MPFRNLITVVSFAFAASCGTDEMTYDDDLNCSGCDLWGDDDRKEAFEIEDPNIRNAIDATALIFLDNNASQDGELYDLPYVGTFESVLQREYDEQTICSDVRFTEQSVLGGSEVFCAAALVGKDTVLTAAHCVVSFSGKPISTEPQSCHGLKIGFGYQNRTPEESISAILNKDIYECEQIVHFELQKSGGYKDLALIKLTETVDDRIPMLPSLSALDINSDVFTIGYPFGLPLKVSSGKLKEGFLTEDAKEMLFQPNELPEVESFFNAEKNNTFFSNMSVFFGNSGGPLIDSEGKLLGIMSYGASKQLIHRFGDGDFTLEKLDPKKSDFFFNINRETSGCLEIADCEKDNILCTNYAGFPDLGSVESLLMR